MRALVALSAGTLVALGSGLPGDAHAARFQVNDEAFADVRLFVQPTAQLRDAAASDGRGVGSDFFLRRARLMLLGNATKQVSFFVDTDSPNFGKGGDFSGTMFVQDAFVSLKIAPELTVDSGLILLPLSHQAMQGAVALNTLDYHSFLIKYPDGGTKIWRDVGAQARGMLFGPRLHYRLGVFGGVRPKGGRMSAVNEPLPDLNPHGHPRVAGQIRYNLFDPETDFFLPGIYLGSKRVVSFGLGGEFQTRAVATAAQVADAAALSADVFVDWPLHDSLELVAQANVIQYDHGSGAATTGTGYFVESGLRYGALEPVLALQRFYSENGRGDLRGYHAGLNWWINGHVANLKADLGIERDVAAQKRRSIGGTSHRTSFTLQSQLFF